MKSKDNKSNIKNFILKFFNDLRYWFFHEPLRIKSYFIREKERTCFSETLDSINRKSSSTKEKKIRMREDNALLRRIKDTFTRMQNRELRLANNQQGNK